jgi:hypothetical protein
VATYVLDRYDAAADRWEPLVAVTKARVEAVTIYICAGGCNLIRCALHALHMNRMPTACARTVCSPWPRATCAARSPPRARGARTSVAAARAPEATRSLTSRSNIWLQPLAPTAAVISTHGCSLRHLWLQEPDEQLVELLGLPSLASPRSGRAEPEPEPEPESPQPWAIRGLSRPTPPLPSAATREIVSQREAVQAQPRRWRAGGGDSWSPAMDDTAPEQDSQARRESCSSERYLGA